MPIALFSISSSLHGGLPEPQDEKFIKEIEKALGEDFDFREDFASYDDKEEILHGSAFYFDDNVMAENK